MLMFILIKSITMSNEKIKVNFVVVWLYRIVVQGIVTT